MVVSFYYVQVLLHQLSDRLGRGTNVFLKVLSILEEVCADSKIGEQFLGSVFKETLKHKYYIQPWKILFQFFEVKVRLILFA